MKNDKLTPSEKHRLKTIAELSYFLALEKEVTVFYSYIAIGFDDPQETKEYVTGYINSLETNCVSISANDRWFNRLEVAYDEIYQIGDKVL